jgi:hypothetical protein
MAPGSVIVDFEDITRYTRERSEPPLTPLRAALPRSRRRSRTLASFTYGLNDLHTPLAGGFLLTAQFAQSVYKSFVGDNLRDVHSQNIGGIPRVSVDDDILRERSP